MSEDRRENILARIEEILREQAPTGSGITVMRDRLPQNENELPAFVLMDSNEEKDKTTTDRRGPSLMVLLPEVFYVPLPPDNRQNVDLPSQTTAMRNQLLRAIMLDGELQKRAGENGYVDYRMLDTDLRSGGEVQGQFRLDLAVAYMLNFRKL